VTRRATLWNGTRGRAACAKPGGWYGLPRRGGAQPGEGHAVSVDVGVASVGRVPVSGTATFLWLGQGAGITKRWRREGARRGSAGGPLIYPCVAVLRRLGATTRPDEIAVRPGTMPTRGLVLPARWWVCNGGGRGRRRGIAIAPGAAPRRTALDVVQPGRAGRLEAREPLAPTVKLGGPFSPILGSGGAFGRGGRGWRVSRCHGATVPARRELRRPHTPRRLDIVPAGPQSTRLERSEMKAARFETRSGSQRGSAGAPSWGGGGSEGAPLYEIQKGPTSDFRVNRTFRPSTKEHWDQ